MNNTLHWDTSLSTHQSILVHSAMSKQPARRRSTRLANAPKISYEDEKVELKVSPPPPTSSSSKRKGRKRRDENDVNVKNADDEEKKFKKIKLRHEVTTELIVQRLDCDDDEDTIISALNDDESTDDESTIVPQRKSRISKTNGRGRPRKSEAPASKPAVSNALSSLLEKAPSPITVKEVFIESDDEINVVEVVNKAESSNKSKVDIETSILEDNNDVETCSSPQEKQLTNCSNIIVLTKKDEDSTISSQATTKSDDPWTIKYKPLSSDQVLDNKQASEQIKDWIHDFTNKSPDNRFYYEDDEDEIDRLEPCVLIHGPTGCGKTAMVYALAEELNYKVFEINCSSRRNSKFINQIKEATLSHTVTRGGGSATSSPVKNNTTKKPIDSKQKNLFNFFQKKKPAPVIDESSLSQETVNNLQAITITSNSLILFDDVDVIFEEDSGFWQALSFLIVNTKRPIILTATNSIDNIKQEVKRALCVQMNYPRQTTLNNHLKEIVYKECYKEADCEPPAKDEHDYVQSPILDKHIRQIELISKDNHCDIRGCVNRLQFDFSSVNMTSNEENSAPTCSRINDTRKDDLKEIDLKSYDNFILCDLFATTDHFQINSRNELDNSCTYDETYKSQDLRNGVLEEFVRLNSEQFKLISKQEFKQDLNWFNNFKHCVEEVENHLVITTKQDFYCDYLPYLSVIMDLEQERYQLYVEHTRRARRFMHYLDNIQFYLSDSAKKFLLQNYLPQAQQE